MQPLFDLAPLLAFVVAYYVGGIYIATAVLMAAMVALVAVDLARHRRVSSMHLMSTILVLVLGSATLILRDPRFLKWKPTIFLWAVALASVVTAWVGRQPLAQRLLGPLVTGSESLPRTVWLRLSWVWGAFYGLLGALNLWVAYRLTERAWVNFKVFGLTAAFLAFAVAQALWLSNRSETLTA